MCHLLPLRGKSEYSESPLPETISQSRDAPQCDVWGAAVSLYAHGGLSKPGRGGGGIDRIVSGGGPHSGQSPVHSIVL